MASFSVRGRTVNYPDPQECEIEKNDLVSDNRIVILLNNRCNFNCIYCYSAMGRVHANPELSLADIKPGIDHICGIQEKKADGCIKASFYGGGEPFASRKVLKEAVEYINERGKYIRRDIKIMTNGSLLKQEDLDWLKSNDVTLVFSFEILEDIQMSQRSQYEVVDWNIRMADLSGLKYRLWTVITPRNVHRFDEIIGTVKEKYPHAQRLNIELVVDDECTYELQDEFLKAFFKVRKTASEAGVNILNSRIGCFELPRKRHCQPEFCITFDGYYTICHTTASNPDIKDMFNFGKDIEGFVNNRQGVEKIIRKSSMNNCENCIAKHYCAGGCIYANLTQSNIVVQSICRFIVNSVKLQILEKEAPELFEEYLNSDQTFDEFANS